jgi:glycosyltransferase involved in cell wall biosynthesis
MKILFVGSFLSRETGTKSIAEKLAEYWEENGGPKAHLVSRNPNKYLRLGSILLGILFYRGKVVNVDVFSGNSSLIAKLAARISKLRGLKLVLTLRGGAIPEDLNQRAEEYRNILSQSDYIQTPSYFLAAAIESKLGIKANYLPNPINLERFIPSPETQGTNLLWVRAFSEIYNPDLAIKTLSILKSDFPDLKLTMIGPDKGILHQAKELVKELGLEDSVDFIGPVVNEKLVWYYQSHAVFLNTTSYESFGTAVVEAAATALPIVSTKVGELPYLWEHDVNIKFSSEIEAKSFAKEVADLLSNPSKALQIGYAGANRVQEFEWDSINKKWISLINNFS